MTSPTPTLSFALPALPLIPATTELHAATRTRLDALAQVVLPQLREQREFLAELWYSEKDDAELLHTSDGQLLACHSAGADRLGTILASEEAFTREAGALRALTAALEEYEWGGPELRQLVGDEPRLPNSFHVGHHEWAPSLAASAARGEVRDPLRYTRQMAAYLSLVRRDIESARASRDIAQLQAYTREYVALQTRLVRGEDRSAQAGNSRQQPRAARADREKGVIAQSA